MARHSDFNIFGLFLVGAFGPIVLGSLGIGGFQLYAALGVWFGIITTGFWRVRGQRCKHASPTPLVIAWAWGLTWWLVPYPLEHLGMHPWEARIFGIWASAIITCAVIWYVTRLRSAMAVSVLAAVTTFAGPVAFLTWPLLVYGALAYWAAIAPRPPDGICASCGYDLAGLPLGAVCPECGNAED